MSILKLNYFIIIAFQIFLRTANYCNPLISDTLPEHYPLIDSLGINYDHTLKVYQTCKAELADPYWPWWDRTALYQSYFNSAVSLFLPIHEIKSIWLESFKNDPYYTCRDTESELTRIDRLLVSKGNPWPMHCLLLRERKFFESHCSSIHKSFDSDLLQAFKAAEKSNENSRLGKALIEQTIDKLGVYPGRSYLGIDG